MRFIFLIVILFKFLAVDALTVEEKVGQLFMVYFDGERVNEHAETLIKQAKIGGIIYFGWANGLKDPEQVKNLSAGLQDLSAIPLFIAIDQEGGRVNRLENGFTHFPSNLKIASLNKPILAYKVARTIGEELKAVGININFAPVVDVNNNPKNPVIGARSFGSDPNLVADMAELSLQGYLDAGIIPCLKHFPGHGDVIKDSHFALPIVDKSLDEIEKIELFPYLRLAKETPMIMTAHILYPRLDSKNPATLSKTILNDILREKLNFNGVIISDSLTMRGVLDSKGSMMQVCLEAFQAGCDILLIGERIDGIDASGNVDEIIHLQKELVKAVKSGKISEERLNESVNRIISLKKNKLNIMF